MVATTDEVRAERSTGPTATPTRAGVAVVEAARALVPHLHEAGGDIEREQRLPPDLVQAFAAADLFRLFLPDELGGGQIDAPSAIRAIELIAEGDGSMGWCLCTQNATAQSLMLYVPEETARALVFEEPLTNFAGTPGTHGTAVVVDGGYRVTGRWTFASGMKHATTLVGGATILQPGSGEARQNAHGQPESRLMYFPVDQVQTVAGSWDTTGLRGTHSGVFTATDLFVPEWRTHEVFGVEPYLHTHYPIILPVFAPVALGIARHALDAFLALAETKVPAQFAHVQGQSTLRERPTTHLHVALAEANLRSARALLYQAVRDVWLSVLADEPMSAEQAMLCQMSNAYSLRVAREVVEDLYHLAGSSAIMRGGDLERCGRDILTLGAHIFVQEHELEEVGRWLVGLNPHEIGQGPLRHFDVLRHPPRSPLG